MLASGIASELQECPLHETLQKLTAAERLEVVLLMIQSVTGEELTSCLRLLTPSFVDRYRSC